MAMESGSTSVSFAAPIANTMDFVELGYNCVCFVLGLPINLLTLRWLMVRIKRNDSPTLWLHLNLNLSDLFVLVFYCFGRFCWLLTYQWYGGDMLCKAMRFAESLSFAISSNILVCIALNRLYLLRQPLQAPVTMARRVPIYILMAWLAAALCSLPQLFVWETYTPISNWTQCLNIWVKAKAQQQSLGEFDNRTELIYTSNMDTALRVYEMYHLLAIFWLPLGILVVCYALIVKEVYGALGEQRYQNADGEAKFMSESRTGSVRSNGQRRERRLTRMESGLTTGTAAGGGGSLKERQKLDNKESRVVLRRNSTSNRRVRRTKLHTLKVTMILMLVYILCWLPYNSLAVWALIDRGSYVTHENTLYVLHGLVVLNSVINPFIYGRINVLRKAMCKKWQLRSNNRQVI